MNSGSFSLEPISQDSLLVTIALALVAILAILTVIGMIWGARLKRRRVTAEHEEQRRMDALEAEGVEVQPDSDTVAPTPPPPRAAPPAPPAAETVALSPAATAEPAPPPAPVEAPPAPDAGAVTILKGLGPKIAARLAELGITRVDQLAWLDDAEAADLDAQMGAFQGRMERDRWREQARLLVADDRAGYEAQFGKLG